MELDEEAERSLSDAIENAIIGGAEIILGVSYLAEGNIPGGGMLLVGGIERVRNSINDFKDAISAQEDAKKRAEEQIRQQQEQNEITNISYIHEISGYDYYGSINNSEIR